MKYSTLPTSCSWEASSQVLLKKLMSTVVQKRHDSPEHTSISHRSDKPLNHTNPNYCDSNTYKEKVLHGYSLKFMKIVEKLKKLSVISVFHFRCRKLQLLIMHSDTPKETGLQFSLDKLTKSLTRPFR